MRLTVIDPQLRFACHDCGGCCTRPWRVVIEEERIAAIQAVDWGARYPRLAGRTLIREAQDAGMRQHVITKDERGACAFYDHDARNCSLHAELGAEAKPAMCRQYPFSVSPAPEADIVNAHFSCPSVQRQRGPLVTDLGEPFVASLATSNGWSRPDVPLTEDRPISIGAARALSDQLTAAFEEGDGGDMWDRFARAVQRLARACQGQPDALEATLREEPTGGESPDVSPTGYPSVARSPLSARMLLAMNLWTDFLPVDSLGKTLRLRQRLSVIGKLTRLAQMRSAYASRLLERNVPLSRVASGARSGAIPEPASDLLRRWIRSRLFARSYAVDHLSIVGGLHALILDLNTVVFLARALSVDGDAPPDAPAYIEALTLTDAHIASQRRIYALVFPSWTLATLESLGAAWSSLRLFCPRAAPPESTGHPTDGTASRARASMP